jgi:hypothetical protein
MLSKVPPLKDMYMDRKNKSKNKRKRRQEYSYITWNKVITY